jgi:hypothetical protein
VTAEEKAARTLAAAEHVRQVVEVQEESAAARRAAALADMERQLEEDAGRSGYSAAYVIPRKGKRDAA